MLLDSGASIEAKNEVRSRILILYLISFCTELILLLLSFSYHYDYCSHWTDGCEAYDLIILCDYCNVT